jgi:hypothetical protein
MQNSVLTTKLSLAGRISAARSVELHFELFFTAFFNGGWWGECGRFVEIDDSCFSRRKCNCSRLHVTAWVFVGVEREWGTPVLHLSLIILLRHCSPSLRHVFYQHHNRQ